MSQSVLVAGFSTRHVARSAKLAGYEVYAVDHFCDRDLGWYTRDRSRFEELDELIPAITEMCQKHQIDWLVPTSGAELLESPVPLLGADTRSAERFMDKCATQDFFEEIGVEAPRLLPPGQFPAMVKPRSGSGGWRNMVVFCEAEKRAWDEAFNHAPAITQEVVSGAPCSVCCVADGSRARAIAVNEQLLRGSGRAEYGFCGSVTPLRDSRAGLLGGIGEKIAAASGCRGTVGIDFVLGDRAWAIEVNPRFQATLDTVEMAAGVNLFSLHARACGGSLPAERTRAGRVAVRTIVFAERDMVMKEDLSRFSPAVADIPWPGTEFEEGQAVISVFGQGADREEAFAMLDKHMKSIQQYMG